MASVSIHPPKTPVTKGSMGIAKATIPNVCKMPGPPAPFVPSPLPNIAKSGMSPDGYSTTVKIEGNAVAIRGATFKSMGDIASKGTGGGLISANTGGPAKFITPGSLTVTIQGKGVHLLGEPMLNNLGASGMPPNTGATMNGLGQQDCDVKAPKDILQEMVCECDKEITQAPGESCMQLGDRKHNCVDKKIQQHNGQGKQPRLGCESGWTKGSPPQFIAMDRKFAMSKQTFKDALLRSDLSGSCWPDAVTFDANGDPQQIFDFKFKCPSAQYEGPPGWGKRSDGSSQKDAYKNLTKRWGKNPNEHPPTIVHNENCP